MSLSVEKPMSPAERAKIQHRFEGQRNRVIAGIQAGTIKTTLPFASMLRLKGEPYNLKMHYFFESLFDVNLPRREVWKCCRQVGKTQNVTVWSLIMSSLVKYFNQLVLCPRFEQVKRVSTNYFRPFLLEDPLRSYVIDPQYEQSILTRKFSSTNSVTHFSFAFMDAERVRSISTDSNWIDEVQDIIMEFIPVIMETMGGSLQWKLQRFTGTPKSFSNPLQRLWDQSSQGTWTIPCSGCNRENIGTVEQHLLEMIGPKGPICYHCGKDLNSPDGYYLHAFPDRRGSFPGRHISQPVHPYHYLEHENWKDLLRKINGQDPTYTKAKVFNECLGESYDDSHKPISLTDLKRASLGGPNTLDYAIRKGKEFVVRAIGIDWGGGGGDETKSYTAICLGGMLTNGNIEVVFVKRLPPDVTDIEEARIILDWMRRFNPDVVAHDYTGGGASRETVLLQAGGEAMRKRLMPFTYSITANQHIIYHKAPQRGTRRSYIIDKPRSLTVMCQMLKHGKILIPQLDKCDSEMYDLLNLRQERTERAHGSDIVLMHKEPETSDDVAHALNFLASGIWYSQRRYPNLAEAAAIALSPEDLEQISPAADRLSSSAWEE